MKDKLHWLIYDKDSPLTNHELSFGCEVKSAFSDGHVVFTQTGVHLSNARLVDGDNYILYFKGNKRASDRPKEGCKILGHPIRIGEVLEQIKGSKCYDSNFDFANTYAAGRRLIEDWYDCDFTKSLQQIFFADDAAWVGSVRIKDVALTVPGESINNCPWEGVQVPKDPAKRALGELLTELFNPKEL